MPGTGPYQNGHSPHGITIDMDWRGMVPVGMPPQAHSQVMYNGEPSYSDEYSKSAVSRMYFKKYSADDQVSMLEKTDLIFIEAAINRTRETITKLPKLDEVWVEVGVAGSFVQHPSFLERRIGPRFWITCWIR